MMGRLLEALRADAGMAPPAIPAIPAIREPHPVELGAKDSGIARIAEGPRPTVERGSSACAAEQAGRLLAALRAECLPDSLLSRDDAEPWQLAALDGAGVRAYARALSRSAEMDAGTIPEDYTQAALCEGCGPVWLWEGAPSRAKGCPWCFRRKAGRTFARPPVACGDCLHFGRDAVHPAAGIGACALGLSYRRSEVGRYPMARRECGDFRPAGNGCETVEERGLA